MNALEHDNDIVVPISFLVRLLIVAQEAKVQDFKFSIAIAQALYTNNYIKANLRHLRLSKSIFHRASLQQRIPWQRARALAVWA
jgi:hypothetical protein